MRPAVRAALRVAFGLAAGLLAAEGILRVYLERTPAPPSASYVADPDCGYRLRPVLEARVREEPDTYVNSFGFRDREYTIEKAPGTRRIVGIGDSFVFGTRPLSEHFLRLAGDELERDGPCEVMLMGLGGYSPENYVGVLRSTGLAVDPDLVVLCFYVGNDILGIATRSTVYRGVLYAVSSASPWVNALRRSRLYAYVERHYVPRIHKKQLRAAAAGDRGTGPRAQHPTADRYYVAVQSVRLPVYHRVRSPEVEAFWTKAYGYLREFDALCRGAGVPWLLVIAPDEIQVDPHVRAEVLGRLGSSVEEYDFDLPQTRLTSFASDLRVPVLDLLPEFRAAHIPDSLLYIPNDTHWSRRGNRLAGRSLAEFVVERFGAAGSRDGIPAP